MILDAMYRKWPSVKHFFADGAYERKSLMDKATYLGFVVEVVKRTPGQTGFQPVAKRWVVERTFGWFAGGVLCGITSDALMCLSP